jgi:hypothetical protein
MEIQVKWHSASRKQSRCSLGTAAFRYVRDSPTGRSSRKAIAITLHAGHSQESAYSPIQKGGSLGNR